MVSAESFIELESSSGTLTFTVTENGWCHVHLVASGAIQALGADAWWVLAPRLERFLTNPATGRLGVFALAELHSTVQGEHVDGGSIIYVHDGSGRLIGKLVLTPAEKRLWLEKVSGHGRRPA